MNELSESQRSSYSQHGWIHLKQFYNPETDFHHFFVELNSLLDYLDDSGISCPPCSSIMDRIYNLSLSDRGALGSIYRSLRHLPSLQHMLMDRRLSNLCRALIPSLGVLNICPYTATRIDIKGEEQYLFDWHQDYHYIQLSEDSVVIWFPFLELDPSGAIEILDSSHKSGIRRAEMIDPFNTEQNGAKTLSILKDITFDAYEVVTPCLEPGDILAFSTLTIHRSLPQTTLPLRLTSQFRYGNFANPEAIRRGWPVGQLEGRPFHLDHSDLIFTAANA